MTDNKEEGSTYFAHTHDETGGGRFGAISNPTINGSEPIVRYPELPASTSFHHDPVPAEPSLGVEIDRLTDPEQVLDTQLASSMFHLSCRGNWRR